MEKIKKGDEVTITSGKDKGKKGRVEKVLRNGDILLPGLNVYKKHIKSQGEGKPGGRVDIARPLGMGKVALVCPKCGKPTRVGFSLNKDKKTRICKKCKSAI